MKSKRFFITLVILGLLASVVIPYPVAAASNGPSKLTVDNKTGKVIYIKLTGPANVNITSLPGQTQKDLARGKYTYTYEACGKTVKGVLKVNGPKVKLKIAACPTSKIVILNKGQTMLNLHLSGPENYSFTVAPNSVLKVTVLRGTYKYTAYWCGGSKSSEISAVKKSYRWLFWCSN